MRKNLLFLFIAVLCSCAKVVPPDGGEVDKTPPQLVLVTPPNYTTNFQSETIYFEFDEFVQLSDVYNQLVVSPPLEKRPEIRIKKRGVVLELKELLKSNTTYTFNFGSGVGDLTENNSAEGLVYVVSTGEVLDSLRVDGLVRDAFTNEAAEGVKVMLYQSSEDSLPKTTRPFYFGLTRADGTFSIQNMAPGNYKAFALKEANNNYLFDDPATESIAFLETPVQPSAAQDSVLRFNVAIPKDTIQYVEDYQTDSTGFLKVLYYQRPLTPELQVIGEQVPWEVVQKKGTDTTYFWLNSRPLNKVLQVVLYDQEEPLDTLDLKFFDVSKQPLVGTSEPSMKMSHLDTMRWKFNRPMMSWDTTLISAMLDSSSVDVEYGVEGFDFYAIAKNASPGTQFQFKSDPSWAISREGFESDSSEVLVQFHDEDHYGALELEIEAELDSTWMLQLLTVSGELISQKYLDGESIVKFEKMEPDTYRFRLIQDSNMNGQWDTVDYDAKLQPERVINYADQVKLRSNWEMKVNWLIE